jgi:hypothetical protein
MEATGNFVGPVVRMNDGGMNQIDSRMEQLNPGESLEPRSDGLENSIAQEDVKEMNTDSAALINRGNFPNSSI